MANSQDSYLSGANISFIEGLYAQFLQNPASVDPSWRDAFEGISQHFPKGQPIWAERPLKLVNGVRFGLVAPAPAPEPSAERDLGLQARVDQTIYAFRLRGHLLAQLDPLGRPRPPLEHIADVGMVNANHFSEEELEQWVDPALVFPENRARVKEILRRLRRTYCEHIGAEFMSVLDSNRRRWLGTRMEHSENQVEPPRDQQRRILVKLSYAEAFEGFLHTKYPTMKRFSLDGSESLIPMLDTMLEVGGTLGMREVVIGMAHRGRLNVLTNILGKPSDQIFREFIGPADPGNFRNRGDVKYHQGFSSDYTTQDGSRIHLSLAFNPSHLEAVDPVVEGRVRAKQDRSRDNDHSRVVPLLIHGDASFIGQGVVAETLNLSRLQGYDTGGTIHIVINNQVGFTTDPSDARSSMYCTAIAQMLDIPIFHVNGDDAEACVHVMRLATEYRQKFKSDVVIDLVSFRRYGHNEGDEPSFTQPEMYELIRKHPTVRQIYAEDLIRRGRITPEEAETIKQSCFHEFEQSLIRAQKSNQFKEPSALEGLWKSYKGGSEQEAPVVSTAVDKDTLTNILRKLGEVPEGFTPHPTLQRTLLQPRKAMAEGKALLDWSAGETLAYATLLSEGYIVRLTGQDTERGTFSHRHAVLHDIKTGNRYTPLQQFVKDPGAFYLYNSPLSEMGCLGFEFGYSLDIPDGLVAWEAQFGDFANNAQVIIDQFIATAERKWRRLSGVTLLLPHGYEGQGPEHSSARLERFLDLCAEDNIQVCYPTTSAQIFHLLRRQVVRPYRKPLIVMFPKSLLRLPEAQSPLEDFTRGVFARVIPDRADQDPKRMTRLLLCSGKVYYDLVKARNELKNSTVAIVRVEQLYPLPTEELSSLLTQMSNLKEVFWVQEEPRNAGAWHYLFPRLHDLVSSRSQGSMKVGFIGRVAAASPATGFHQAHDLEQRLIVEEAIPKGPKHVR